MRSLTASCLLVAVLATSAVAGPAAAETNGPVVVQDNNGGIDTSVIDPGSPGSSTPGGGTVVPVRGGPAVTCTYVPDTSQHSGGAPAWEQQSPHASGTGAWYFRSCTDGTFTPVWIPTGTATPGVPTVTPIQMAQQAYNYLPLPAPDVRHNPDRQGGRPQTVVGLPTWLWVSGSSFRVLTQTTSAGAVSATVTATPSGTDWTTGSPDAADVHCPGAGTAYDPTRPAAQQSTDCATTYRRSSAGQPRTGAGANDRFFVGTATTTWRVTWTGTGGTGGTLPDLRRTSRFPLAVAELQAVNR